MTIALSLKVNDGVVLAADSATTMATTNAVGQTEVINIYNNANKVFRLGSELPVGGITWGLGNIGAASISTIAKELKRRLTGKDPGHSDWKLDPENYTVEQVSVRLKELVFDELYTPFFQAIAQKPALGFVVAGYSATLGTAEEFVLEIKNGACVGPNRVRQTHESGCYWAGQPEAISRVLLGHGGNLPNILESKLGVPTAQIEPAMKLIRANLSAQVVQPAMPIQDAIDLAEFLVDLTIKYVRFTPGSPTVGGPVEVAAITKHEGFVWVKHKHYFPAHLNAEKWR